MTEIPSHSQTEQAAQASEMSEVSMAAKRAGLVSRMLDKQLISAAFSKSGVLEAFSLDEERGRDALSHLLIGDKLGGAHHLPTMLAVGSENTRAASIYINPEKPKKNRAYYRGEQRVRESGAFEAKIVDVSDGDDGALKKSGGSVFFPNEWPAQQVLEAAVQTSQEPGEHSPDNRSYKHVGEVDGVKLAVYTDDMTGKITSAHPIHPRKK